MNEDKYSNPAEVFETFIKELNRFPYQKKNGTVMPILAGLIDRGGHRSGDVDYIVDHSPSIGAYIGSTQKLSPLIEQKKSGHYHGNTENLSRIVIKQMESKIWHLPKDIQPEYCSQVLNQYDEEIIDTRGNKKKKWTCKDPDHFRDCENYLAGLVIALDLQSQLFDEMNVANIEKEITESAKENSGEDKVPRPEEIPDNFMDKFSDEMGAAGW
jgi:hypothetical protein